MSLHGNLDHVSDVNLTYRTYVAWLYVCRHLVYNDLAPPLVLLYLFLFHFLQLALSGSLPRLKNTSPTRSSRPSTTCGICWILPTNDRPPRQAIPFVQLSIGAVNPSHVANLAPLPRFDSLCVDPRQCARPPPSQATCNAAAIRKGHHLTGPDEIRSDAQATRGQSLGGGVCNVVYMACARDSCLLISIAGHLE